MTTTIINDVSNTVLQSSNSGEILILTRNAGRAAVWLNDSGADLFNYGTVYQTGGDAVAIGAGGTEFWNLEGGAAAGSASGISIETNGNVSVVNEGLISGATFHGINIINATVEVSITNRGEIIGNDKAILCNGGMNSVYRIDNSGLIRGNYGVVLDSAGSVLTFNNSGEVGSDIEVAQGTLKMTNSGIVRGNIAAGASNDTIVNNGTVGQVLLGGGNDVYRGNGTVGFNVRGDAGNDVLTGGPSADVFLGGANNDILNGGLGKDTLTGGAHNDTFKFTAIGHSKPGALADVITDFDDSGNDRIDLSALFGPAMTYRHNLAFTAAGQVRINDVAGADVMVEVNTGGSLAPDFAIRLVDTTLTSMTKTDFVL